MKLRKTAADSMKNLQQLQLIHRYFGVDREDFLILFHKHVLFDQIGKRSTNKVWIDILSVYRCGVQSFQNRLKLFTKHGETLMKNNNTN